MMADVPPLFRSRRVRLGPHRRQRPGADHRHRHARAAPSARPAGGRARLLRRRRATERRPAALRPDRDDRRPRASTATRRCSPSRSGRWPCCRTRPRRSSGRPSSSCCSWGPSSASGCATRGPGSSAAGWPRRSRWSLAIGQAQVAVTFLVALGSPWAIALAGNLKILPIIVAIYWIGRRDWRAVGRFVVTVQVPLFVNIGDRVKVDTRSGDYLTRV